MSQFGTCRHCKNEWYTICTTGKLRLPKHIPTCPEASIMAVCVECFDKLPSEEISAIAITLYNSGIAVASEPGIHMSQTEHLLVAAAIKGWVAHMKGETTETPFDQQALAL
jgi:hypothetical protein